MSTFVIAEAGVNHNGSLDQALKMVKLAADAGANAIKFQTFKTEELVTPTAQIAEYQKADEDYQSQFELLKKLELDLNAHQELQNYCEELDIEFMSSPFDLKSLELLEKLNVKRYKIASGEITNYPLIKAIAEKGKPIILSSGMSNLQEVEACAQVILSESISPQQLSILHANTEYPTPMEDVHLRAMVAMGEHLNLAYGYSDHTAGVEVPIAAVALGASVIEKHFTFDKHAKGPDHKASLDPAELFNMIQAIRNIEVALGSDIKQASQSETKNMNIARKSIVAKKTIKKGEQFTELNLTTKRPGTGISPMKWKDILGKKAEKDYQMNDML